MVGTIIKDFARSENNARNSEGAFYRMDSGTIAFVYSRYRGGSHGDDASCDLAVSFSYDNGKSFTDSETVLTLEECNASNLMSVSMLRMNDGKIGVFYLKKTPDFQCRMFLRKTEDFKTFSPEIQCICDRGYFVVNNDRVVRLKNGRIIIPSAYLSLPLDDARIATARFYASDDDGQTFKLISEIVRPYDIMKTGLQEPGIIEFEDKIVAFFRNDLGRQYISYSYDNAESWTVPVPSRFTSPISPMSAKQLSDGTVIAIYNPVPMYYGHDEMVKGIWTGNRTPLLASLCRSNLDDEYKTLLIEDDPDRGFCYIAILETEEDILLGYCAGGLDDGCTLTRLRIRAIPKDLLKEDKQ